MELVTIKTGSENTIKAYTFLKDNEGTAFTIAEVAEALGLRSPQVTGGLVSLEKKGVIAKSPREMEDGKVLQQYTVVNTNVEFEMNSAGAKGLTPKSKEVLDLFKGYGVGVKKMTAEAAEDLGKKPIQITGILNSLVRRNLVEKDSVELELDGKTTSRVVYALTEEGSNYED